MRVLLVLIHLRTNLTTRALAALFDTSQSTVDRIIDHLVPVFAQTLRPVPDATHGPQIIDATLIPVRDQTITAIAKNYRRSINTHVIICVGRRRVAAVGRCWPASRNDVLVARHTLAQLLTGERAVLGDGGYRGIDTIATPARDRSGRIIHNDGYPMHRRVTARVEHVRAPLKDWQILRQSCRRGHTINHARHIIAGLWNLKTHKPLRVNS